MPDKQIENDPLENVMTVPEAAEVFGYHRRHVWYLCDSGAIKARKSATSWILDKSSMSEYVRLQSIRADSKA